jgi:Protein of unknown function (DUF1559)
VSPFVPHFNGSEITYIGLLGKLPGYNASETGEMEKHLAMHNYESALRTLPPGWLVHISTSDNLTASANGNATTGNGNCFSAYAFLMPQLDQSVIYNRVNFNSGPDTAANNDMSITQPPVFVCPSDSGVGSLAQGVGFAGVTNYVLNTGTTFPVSTRNPAGIQVTGW